MKRLFFVKSSCFGNRWGSFGCKDFRLFIIIPPFCFCLLFLLLFSSSFFPPLLFRLFFYLLLCLYLSTILLSLISPALIVFSRLLLALSSSPLLLSDLGCFKEGGGSRQQEGALGGIFLHCGLFLFIVHSSVTSHNLSSIEHLGLSRQNNCYFYLLL